VPVRILRLAPLAALAAVAVWAIASGAVRRLSFAQLQSHHAAMTAYVHAHPAQSLALYLAADVAVVAACIPGPGLMCVIGGFLFGAWLGGAAALAGAVAGSLIAYGAVRFALGERFVERLGERPARLVKALRGNAFSTLLTIRLMPVTPLMLINIAAGAARAPVGPFAAASALGGAPVSFVLAFLGAGLGGLFARGQRADPSMLFAPRILIPLAALAALSGGALIWRLMRRRGRTGSNR
jgi:uncharacterized membrane protein YdjX (TVP38/TMEM64 family)